MDIHQYDIEIKRHAFIRALQRMISPDKIESTIKGGQIKRFGKHNIKFIKRYKGFTVICVGEISGNKIKILTIERGN